eukprot:CAMPEP_0171779534 /NCGR_PEP_ID=MMETSP0991-20121206/59065_1 /TAXON_ID=483369 /ORGANISM="non described non described, Strain CCMP2098" /LENGTH=514 /DNA_ID=CAMNT_0012386719 /DNA_START=687 /DNA_END=2231 /DNA_ORIENTATION=+
MSEAYQNTPAVLTVVKEEACAHTETWLNCFRSENLLELVDRATAIPSNLELNVGTNLLHAAHKVQLLDKNEKEAKFGALMCGRDIRVIRCTTTEDVSSCDAIETYDQGRWVDEFQVSEALEKGFSVVVRSAHFRWPRLQAIVEALEADLGLIVSANVYLTPGVVVACDNGASSSSSSLPTSYRQGLPLHRDDHDVLVLQLEGSKHWEVEITESSPLLHLSQINDEPSSRNAQTLGKDVHSNLNLDTFSSRAALPKIGDGDFSHHEVVALASSTSVLLETGSALYIPRGYAHCARNHGTGPSLHVSLAIEPDEAFTWFGAICFLLIESNCLELVSAENLGLPLIILSEACDRSLLASSFLRRISLQKSQQCTHADLARSFQENLAAAVGVACDALSELPPANDSGICFDVSDHNISTLSWLWPLLVESPRSIVSGNVGAIKPPEIGTSAYLSVAKALVVQMRAVLGVPRNKQEIVSFTLLSERVYCRQHLYSQDLINAHAGVAKMILSSFKTDDR